MESVEVMLGGIYTHTKRAQSDGKKSPHTFNVGWFSKRKVKFDELSVNGTPQCNTATKAVGAVVTKKFVAGNG